MSAGAASAGELSAGTVVAERFTVVRTLGQGGQGIVYEAERKGGGGRVALKVLHRHLCGDPQIFKRLHREAKILKRLEGEQIVEVLDFVEAEGVLAIALAYVDGRSLEEVIGEGPVPIPDAVEVTLQVCAALGVAHAAGVVHRDLKPANVLLERSAPGAHSVRVRVVDFGLAKVVHGEHMTTGLTEQDMIFGTPEYMAPEQVRGEEVDATTDLYAAGAILYEMAVGRPPFRGKTPLMTMTAHLSEKVQAPRAAAPSRGISTALEAVILRALEKEPKDRFPSARAFAHALAAAREEARVVARASGTDDAESLATSDTELNVTAAGAAAVAHAEEASGPRAVIVVAPSEGEGRTLRTPSSGRWVWAVVALVAAAVGVAIGALVGTR